MPHSPVNHEIVITQDFWASPGAYPKSPWNKEGRHTGLDIRSPYDDPWFSVVPGFLHLEGTWPYLTGYGAGWGLDWGKANGGHIRFRYAHAHNRKRQYDNHHVSPGLLIGYSGATGTVRPRGKAGAHLHLEMLDYDERGRFLGWLNPRTFLEQSRIPYRHAYILKT